MLAVAVVAITVVLPQTKSSFDFHGNTFVHRYSKDDLHEFTPKSQPDLKRWQDMVTVNVYPSVKDGESLAKAASSVVETYKSNKGMVVRTNSVPRTAKREAEHFVAAIFGRPDFIEITFARFVMTNGVGKSIVYSHRIYGKKAGDGASAWLSKNGERIEKSLMALSPLPATPKGG